jgi:hypothetical protein
MFVEGNELSVHSYHTACVFVSDFSGGSNTNELLQLCMLNCIWAYTELTYKLCIKYCVYVKSNRKFQRRQKAQATSSTKRKKQC